jgi:hypothetical protein
MRLVGAAQEGIEMNRTAVLIVTSLLSIILFSIHWADDIVHGLDRVGLQNVGGFVIISVWLYGTLLLAERRSGLIIVLLGSTLAVGVATLHLSGARIGAIAQSSGGRLFIWTLYALGSTGLFAFILSVRGLVALRSTRKVS